MSDKKRGKILVFSAPSGAGKTTLLKYLIKTVPGLVYSISATTRKPRPGERHGEHYFFMQQQEFKERVEKGEFAEWELVHGNYYGTPKKFIDEVISSSRSIIMDIDVYGKKKFDAVYPEAVGILIVPPSAQELERRLRGRNTDDEATVRLRLQNAKKELQFAREQGRYEYEIVNDDLEQTRCELVELVKKLVNE
ncbi:guanylate kinase [Chitinispirillales bacterium ANBcel5]|uniref:guanylate kinase n=1 Tax=Cellulosispirillum alkaliphilum TaxID=3039283 RepID=UPI002A5874F3|nr:guanylate kinase [Chitinispirillales bacterium ANBcel5]